MADSRLEETTCRTTAAGAPNKPKEDGRTNSPQPEQPGPAPGLHNTLQQVGRYRVERLLGRGGFGCVYLAHDDELQRAVAIKVPHEWVVSNDEEHYLSEARALASLDHPHIVPVYDVGRTERLACYFVSKYIEGTTLSATIKERRPSWTESAELVACIADALHYAHKQGFVHRDVKPGNILIDCARRPYLTDFGLVLKESDAGRGPSYCGTPSYMSPEQARGEAHRV